MTTTATKISENLQALSPIHLELVNESMSHAGYFEGKESHFKLTIVSDEFSNLNMVKRHQKIYALLNELMTAQGGTIHALALHAYSPNEWQNIAQSPNSPNCAGANI